MNHKRPDYCLASKQYRVRLSQNALLWIGGACILSEAENCVRKKNIQNFPTTALFNWYNKNARDLPWRRRWPELAPAYHVWLSEIMLQQTVVATVIPYFLEFIRRWPTINSLAAAPVDDVLAAWAGLGYYARARNLHRAAVMVAHEWQGDFYLPNAVDDCDGCLRTLPGVGPYTAGAIAAIAFGRQTVVVDGNIERLLSRYFGIETPFPAAKAEIAVAYKSLLPVERPSDLPQALMDFANAVCTPKSPTCDGCYLAVSCTALAKNITHEVPAKPFKKAKPSRLVVAFVAVNHRGEVFLQRRPEKGLLGGMLGFPETGLSSKTIDTSLNHKVAPFKADWVLLDIPVLHIFTHFVLEAHIYFAFVDGNLDISLNTTTKGEWQPLRPTDLPSLMQKIWIAVSPLLLRSK